MRLHLGDRLEPVAGLRHDDDFGRVGQQDAQPFAHDLMIVGDDGRVATSGGAVQRWRRSLALAGLALAAFLQAGPAAALDLRPGEHYRDIARQVTYLEDRQNSVGLETAIVHARAGAFAPLPRERIDFGFTASRIWLRLAVRNVGATEAAWRLAANARFMTELEAYQVQPDGAPRLILRDHWTLPFPERDAEYRSLVGDFTLAAGEESVLYVAYRSDGSTYLPLSVETATSFEHRQAVDVMKNVAFYAMVGLLLFFALAFLALLRTRAFLAYALYLGSVTLYVLQADGVAFQRLWPGLPAWNNVAALPLGLLINVFAANFSREFLDTRRFHPRLDGLLLGFMALTLATIASAAVVDTRLLKQSAFLYTFGGSLLFLGSGLVALSRRTRGVRFYVTGWAGITAAALFASVAHWSPGLLAVNATYDVIRVGIVFDAMMMALAIMDQLNRLTVERDRAQKGELAALQEKVALQQRVLSLQERHAEAEGLAAARALQLAAASHDLRQPLFSLRAAMRQVADVRRSGALTMHMEQSLDYLQGLIDRYLDAAVSDRAQTEAAETSLASTAERFSISTVLDNVRFLFAEQASGKGLKLRYVRSTARVQADPVVVMRIVNNLTSNAIKYTNAGSVLLGCRVGVEAVRVEVHDTGPGVPAGELDRLTSYLERGEDAQADGHGLGLAIAADLARRHGHRLEIGVGPGGRGTSCRLWLPASRSA